jgi:FixJ family two-component response regulator
MNPRANLDGKVIAIVDDHEVLRHSMQGLLEAYGAKVLAYKGGDEFLRDLPSADCVVVDYYMPGLNGVQLASELRSRGYGAPVILLTGMSNEVPKHWAALGVNEVVDKLSGGDELLRMIHQHAT